MIESVETSKYSRKATVNFATEEIEKERKSEFNALRREASMPGFRKGKVPMDILKRRYGGRVEATLAEKFKTTAVQKVFKEMPHVLGVVDAKLMDLKTMTYEVYYDERPQFENIVWEGLEVTAERHTLTDADIDKEVERIARNNATLEPLSDGEKGTDEHIAWVNAKALREGLGGDFLGESKFYRLKGEGAVPAKVAEKILGSKVGAKIIFTSEDLEMKLNEGMEHFEAVEVELLGFKKEIMPELNDDFVLDLGIPDVSDMAGMRDVIRRQREMYDKMFFEQTLISKTLEALRKANPVEEVPAQYTKNAAAQWMILNMARMSDQEITPQMAHMLKENVSPELMSMFGVYTHDFLILDALTASLNIRGDIGHLFELCRALYGDEPDLFKQLAEVPIVLSAVTMYSTVIRKIIGAAKLEIVEVDELTPASEEMGADMAYSNLTDILRMSRLTGFFLAELEKEETKEEKKVEAKAE